jgi:ubiquinone/menaquinone biosynthesis C-methylase UbiE
LPVAAVDSFTGVSNVAIFAEIHEGDVVLDPGCGAGLDSLIAAHRVGPSGMVIGIDFSKSMLMRARGAAVALRAQNVRFYVATAERLPLKDGCVDVVLVNGIFNLNPQREPIFRELARVIRPGGCLFAAELVLKEPLAPGTRLTEDDWFA